MGTRRSPRQRWLGELAGVLVVALVMALVIALVMALPGPAYGFVRARDVAGRPLRWERGVVELRLDGGGQRGVPADRLLAAAERAGRVWGEQTGPRLRWTIGREGAGRVAEDGINAVVVQTRRWRAEEVSVGLVWHEPQQWALTHLRSRTSPRTSQPCRASWGASRCGPWSAR